jgi:hypothetical protein
MDCIQLSSNDGSEFVPSVCVTRNRNINPAIFDISFDEDKLFWN